MKPAKSRTGIIASCAAFVFCIGMVCEGPTTVTHTSETFSPGESAASPQAISGRFYLLHPGDTASLHGTRRCSTIVDGRLESAALDSIHFRSITSHPITLSLPDSDYVVYPQKQECIVGSAAPHSVVRYLERNSLGVWQRAYEDDAGFHVPRVAQVLPETLVVGTSWPTTPLVPVQFNVGSMAVSVSRFSAVERAIASWVLGGHIYEIGVSVVTYCSVRGFDSSGGNAINVMGTIESCSYYFRDRGLLQTDISARIEWRVDGGASTVQVQHIHFDRGDTAVPSRSG